MKRPSGIENRIARPTMSKEPVIPLRIPPGMGSPFMVAIRASIDEGVTSVKRRKLKFLYPLEMTSQMIKKRGTMAREEKRQTRKNMVLSFAFLDLNDMGVIWFMRAIIFS
jgi:hypothetical protein